MTIYSFDVILSQFGTSLLFHVQLLLFVLDLHTDFSGGRSGGLVFPSLRIFQFVVVHTVKDFSVVNETEVHFFFQNSLAYSMIQQMLAIWSLVPLPFLNPACTSEGSQFTYCWSQSWRILSITLLACEMSVVVWQFEHFFGTAFLWNWNENWPFPVLWPLLSFPNLLAYWVQHFHSIFF